MKEEASSLSELDAIPVADGALRVFPLGGLGEIGMNCMVVESKDSILVIDCGVMFSDLDNFGIEFVIPDFSYLVARADKIKGIILTHGHEDHVGALPNLIREGVRAPLYASQFTSLMLREKLTEFGMVSWVDLHPFKCGDKLRIGEFSIETVSVNHSIVDAAALIIDTPHGKIVHTGDFKIDPHPYFGQKMDETVFRRAGEEGVLLLMSDSTNVERHEHSKSEKTIFESFDRLFAAAEGLTVVAMFSSNVSRVAQVLELAQRQGKKVILSGRSMEQNVRLAQEAGYIRDMHGILVRLDDFDRYDRKDVIVLTTGTQGEYRSALVRVANGEHSTISLEDGDRVLMSSRFIPGNEKDVGRMINNLFRQGADVLYEATHQIHVSGHATRPELRQMIEWTKPRFFLPIHGEYRHLVHHARLASETGMRDEQILVAQNGDVLEISEDRFERVYTLEEEPKKFVDGSRTHEITRDILRERRKLAEGGVAFVLLTLDPDSGKIIAGPEMILNGVATPEQEGAILEKGYELLRKLARQHAKNVAEGVRGLDFAETIRLEVRRMIQSITDRKIVVVPFILDL